MKAADPIARVRFPSTVLGPAVEIIVYDDGSLDLDVDGHTALLDEAQTERLLSTVNNAMRRVVPTDITKPGA